MITNSASDKRRQVDRASTQGFYSGHNDNESKPARPEIKRSSFWLNLLLLVVSVLLTLAFVEFAYRLAAGQPIAKLANWRSERVLASRIGEHFIADPVLGWTVKAWDNDLYYTTIDYGIRKNRGETTIRTGAILAVGDSFTEGFEVANGETWPAYLERFTGMPVVNGGVSAFATDQIILRAEQLLPIVQPKLLIIGFLEHDIYRSVFSVFGAPKPYYTLENGELHFHAPESVEPQSQSSLLWSTGHGIRKILEYSALADFFLARLAPNYWYSQGSKGVYRTIESDAAAVTCALLARLKTRLDQEGIRTLLFMQHDAHLILAGDKSSANAQRVVACAQAAGIPVVDQFQSLRTIMVAAPNAVRYFYRAYEGGLFGHMTAEGNQHAAKLLAEVLSK